MIFSFDEKFHPVKNAAQNGYGSMRILHIIAIAQFMIAVQCSSENNVVSPDIPDSCLTGGCVKGQFADNSGNYSLIAADRVDVKTGPDSGSKTVIRLQCMHRITVLYAGTHGGETGWSFIEYGSDEKRGWVPNGSIAYETDFRPALDTGIVSLVYYMGDIRLDATLHDNAGVTGTLTDEYREDDIVKPPKPFRGKAYIRGRILYIRSNINPILVDIETGADPEVVVKYGKNARGKRSRDG